MATGACRPVSSYAKGEKLGEGTYGSVYKAVDKATGRVVALKRVKEKNLDREGMPQTSLREVALLRRLRHPHIVSLVEVVVGSRVDSIFLVFEYCAFELARLVDSLPKPFPLAEVKCALHQLLRAVAHLHANGILHRDLKLSNLLINDEGELKLCDFGLAREHSADDDASEHSDGPYTPRMVTLWYRAPELLLNAPRYGLAVDMWSVGCILGELLLHRPLLPGSNETQQLEMIFELLGTPSVSIWPDLAALPAFRDVVQHMDEQPYNELPTRLAKMRPSDSTLDFINGMLTFDPKRRLTVSGALRHRWFHADYPLAAKNIGSVVALAKRKEAQQATGDGRTNNGCEGNRSRKRTFDDGLPQASDASHRLPRPHAAPGPESLSASARIPSPNDVFSTAARQC